MTIEEQLIREIEQAPEATLIKFMQIWQFSKQSASIIRTNSIDTKHSDFFANHHLPKFLLMKN